jgi:hypothetical protein
MIGHRSSTADGLCSPTAAAVEAVAGGTAIADAARLSGLTYGPVWRAVQRAAMPIRSRRTPVIRSRAEAMRRAIVHGRGRHQAIGATGHTTWEAPPEVAAMPRINTAGADHAEAPDPPALLEVGWRTMRTRRPSDS